MSLQDPVGVIILRLQGTWRVGGRVIDVNDSSANQGVWTVGRGGRRATLRVVDQLTVNNEPIVTGAQVSRLLDVGAQVVSAAPAALLPIMATAAVGSLRQAPLGMRGLQ